MRITKALLRKSLVVLTLFPVASAVLAQDARLNMESLDLLGSKAADGVEVNLDGVSIKLAASALSAERSPAEASIKEVVSRLTGIYVRNLEFEKPGEYSDSDLAPIRQQLVAPMWSRVVGVRSKRGGDNIEVYAVGQGEEITGLAIISTDPRRVTVVNIIGPIEIDKLADLARVFGVPGLEVDAPGKPDKE